MFPSGPPLGDAMGSARMDVRALARSQRQASCDGSALVVGCNSMGLADIPSLLNPKTTTVTLYGNAIASIPSGAFKTVVNLKILNLADNAIRSIPPGAFTTLVNLQTLHLYKNQIVAIPTNSFDGLNKLIDLEFRWKAADPLSWLGKKNVLDCTVTGNPQRMLFTDETCACSEGLHGCVRITDGVASCSGQATTTTTVATTAPKGKCDGSALVVVCTGMGLAAMPPLPIQKQHN